MENYEQPSLQGWHYEKQYKCPRCGKQGVVARIVRETELHEFWCPKEFDNKGCGWKSNDPFHDPDSLESKIADLKDQVRELENDIEWILDYLKSTVNPDESELITGYFKLRRKSKQQ